MKIIIHEYEKKLDLKTWREKMKKKIYLKEEADGRHEE